MSDQSHQQFSLGRTVTTRGALLHLVSVGIPPGILLQRHATGDWGDLCASDKHANAAALLEGGRILSAYVIGNQRLYAITEADRSVTTILLASEY